MPPAPKIPDGFSLSSGSLGLRDFQDTANGTYPKNKEKDDTLFIFCEEEADTAAVFTQNIFAGAPVLLNKKSIQKSEGKTKAVLVNTVFSNAGTGEEGVKNAEKVQDFLAKNIRAISNCPYKNENILLASTGKIGPQIPVEKFEVGIPKLLENFDNDITRAGKAILTTDLVEKIEYREVSSKLGVVSEENVGAISNRPKILGLAKGSGMIAPNMATMLAFVLTDAKVDPKKLQKKWKEICENSFNQVSVDNCESTSDMALVLSSQKYEVNEKEFFEKLEDVAKNLAKKIAADGEGATHLIEVQVENWRDEEEAKLLAKSVVTGDLFKAAVAGHDPNWGRICGALGSTKIPFDPKKLDISIDGVFVYKNGSPQILQAGECVPLFQKKEVIVKIDFHSGKYSATAWGCDLTKKYVEINAEYST